METSNGAFSLTQFQLTALLCDSYIDIFDAVGEQNLGPLFAAVDQVEERRDFILGIVSETLDDPDFIKNWPPEEASRLQGDTACATPRQPPRRPSP